MEEFGIAGIGIAGIGDAAILNPHVDCIRRSVVVQEGPVGEMIQGWEVVLGTFDVASFLPKC